MATIKISTPEYDFELENSELIPATQEQLEAIVSDALKGAKKKTSKEVMAEIVPKINKELDRLFSEAGAYVKALKPEKGDKGDRGNDGEVTEQHKLEIALSVESQLGPKLEQYADERIEAYQSDHTALHEALDSELQALEQKIDSIEIPEAFELEIDDVVSRLESLKGDNRLDAKAIKNLPEAKTIVQGGGSRGVNVKQLGGQEVLASELIFDGATVASDGRKVTVTVGSPLNDTDDLAEGASNLYYTDERVDDRVNNLIVGGDNITATYDDGAGTLTLDAADQGVGISTRAGVFDANTAGENTFTSDTKQEYIEDGTDSWFHPIPLVKDELGTGSNAGPQVTQFTRYNAEYVTDIGVYNSQLGAVTIEPTTRSAEKMLRTVELASGNNQLQYYTDGRWNAVLTGVSLQEDSNFRLEFQPFGTDFWIESHTGNSNITGLNGRSIIQEYELDTGANPIRRIFSGRFFDGTGFTRW